MIQVIDIPTEDLQTKTLQFTSKAIDTIHYNRHFMFIMWCIAVLCLFLHICIPKELRSQILKAYHLPNFLEVFVVIFGPPAFVLITVWISIVCVVEEMVFALLFRVQNSRSVDHALDVGIKPQCISVLKMYY